MPLQGLAPLQWLALVPWAPPPLRDLPSMSRTLVVLRPCSRTLPARCRATLNRLTRLQA
nr:MAG TPA: hypothetical protein [Caudoviricetes sp.]